MANKFNFTIQRLEQLDREPNKRSYVYDTQCPGLALSITPTGVKSFLVYRKVKGQPVRVTLGRFPELKIAQARKLATKTIALMLDGKNPNKVERAKRERGKSLQEVFDDYLNVRSLGASKLRPSTIADYKVTMNVHFPDWKGKGLRDIKRSDIRQRHHQISTNSPAVADKAMRLLRALFNFAREEYLDEDDNPIYIDNPVKNLSHRKAWNHVQPKNGVIKADKVGEWLHAVETLRCSVDSFDRMTADYFELILMTGLRRREAANLRVRDLDFENKTLNIPDTKNGDPVTLPMSSRVSELLLSRTLIADDYIFESKNGKPLSDPRRQIQRIRDETGIQFTLHDLRRTFITTAEALNTPHYAIKRLVNHRIPKGDVTAGYIIWDVDRLRQPSQEIAAFFMTTLQSCKEQLAVSAT